MRITSFIKNGQPSFGIVDGNQIVDCGKRLGANDLRSFMQTAELAELSAHTQAAADFSLDQVTLLPVIANAAARFFCIGINYRPHMLEMGRDLPERPVVFARFASSFVGHDQPMQRPAASAKFDFEGELAVIIGKRARRVTREHALDYVAGYACLNDGSVRDFQRHSGQFTPGKNFDASGAFGPWMVTSDELPDPSALQLTTRLNGEVVQSESTGELLFDIPSLIEYISIWTELQPGDVIATGTPGGVGAGRTPPLWMQANDIVEVEISGIGCLRNPIVDEDVA